MPVADFSGLGALKGLYSSLVNTMLPIAMMIFMFLIILSLIGGGVYWLKNALSLAHEGAKPSKSFITRLAIGLGMGLMVFGMFIGSVISGQGAVAASIGTDQAMVGVPVTVQITGLTAASTYAVVAQHSAGNITKWVTPSGTEAFVDFTFSSADSDNQVPIHVYTTSAGAISYSSPTTIYVQLSQPSDYINQAFFLLIMVTLVLIGIVLTIVKKFL